MLAAMGFYETLTNSLTNIAYRNKINAGSEAVEILNKLSEEQGILRQTMLFSGLEVCAHNINRKQKDLKLFRSSILSARPRNLSKHLTPLKRSKNSA